MGWDGLLEALAEAQAISRRPLEPGVRSTLETVQGEGRVKKLAQNKILSFRDGELEGDALLLTEKLQESDSCEIK